MVEVSICRPAHHRCPAQGWLRKIYGARHGNNLSHMLEKVLVLRDFFDHRPELTALAEKIIVRIDQQQTGCV